MNESRISVRYSRALFQSALEKKILDRVYRDMIHISEICTVPGVKEVLESPIIIPSKKTEILLAVFGNDLSETTISLVEMVVRNGRENFLPAIARVFMHETKEYKGITETVLTTAVKVDAEIKKQISEFISDTFKTKVELKEIVDKDIIGGFMLKIEDKYIDASIKSKLRKVEKELKNRALIT